MLVTRQIASLFNGVSQQPPPVRSPSQWEWQENVTSSVVDGIRKRSPVEHVAKISNDRFGRAHMHTINRDINERYQVVINRSRVRVFDMAGNEKTVTAPLGFGYLSLPTTAQGRYAFTAVTVADYTFIVNKTKKVAMLGVGADLDPPSDDYWWLNRPASYGTAPSLGPVLAPDGDEHLGAGGFLPDDTPPPPPYDGGGTTSSSNPQPAPLIVPSLAGHYKGTKQTLQDLPETGQAVGDVYKITGTDQSNFQSYYVVWSGSVWNETVQPGLRNLVDASTMPHALIRQGDGTFVFGPFAWAARRVGDEATNPNPTFVGRTINDVFFYRNRLGFCVDENVVLSRAGDFGNFYRLTVVDYLPDEVVDVAASETKVTKMEFAVPFQGSTMLFSDQTQFKLEHEQVFSAGTVSLEVATEYPSIPGVRPAKAGSDVYFPSQGNGWGQLREYYVTSDTDTHDAADVSSHVPRYLPKSLHTVVASPDHDTVCVLSDGQPNHIHVYQFYWQSETEKAQSAWNFWSLEAGAAILTASVQGEYLYLLVDRADGTYLERISLFYGSGAAALPFQVYLDRRVKLTGVYDRTVNRTFYTLPYDVADNVKAKFRIVLGNVNDSQHLVDEAGNVLTDESGNELTELTQILNNGKAHDGAGNKLTWTSPSTFSLAGSHPEPAAAGFIYSMRAIFSRQYPQNSRGEPVHTGRLQLKTFSLQLTDTAYLRAEIRPYGAGTDPLFVHEFPSTRLGIDGRGIIDDPAFVTEKVTFGVQANAAEAEITLVNDSHLGCCINAAEWEGFYTNRARA